MKNAAAIGVSMMALTSLTVVGCATSQVGPETSTQSKTQRPQAPSAATGTPEGTSVFHANVAGYDRTWYVHTPDKLSANEKVPLIFAFHGRGETAKLIHDYSQLDNTRAIVIYPEALPDNSPHPKATWQTRPTAATNGNQGDLQLVKQILSTLDDNPHKDPTRVYAVGKSNGGGFATWLGAAIPGKFAAVASIAGAYYPDVANAVHADHTPFPFLEVHGTDDQIAPYNGRSEKDSAYDETGAEVMSGMIAKDVDQSRSNPEINDVAKDVTQYRWQTPAGKDVIHYKVDGGNHNWPGSHGPSGPEAKSDSLDTTKIVTDFFNRYHL